jgi:Replication-relaxation
MTATGLAERPRPDVPPGPRYWFSDPADPRKAVELEVDSDGFLYRRPTRLERALGTQPEREAVAVSSEAHDTAPCASTSGHPLRCMCRGCRISPHGVYCPCWDDAAPAPDGYEPNRVVWSDRDRRWRPLAEVEAERAQVAHERRERELARKRAEAEQQRAEQEALDSERRALELRRAQWPPPARSGPEAASYAEAHRYDGVLLTRGERQPLRKPVVATARDLEILTALWRHRVLSTAQIKELWWPQARLRKAQERLKELFDLGLVDRFRTPAIRGSYPWIYLLARDGHALLQDAGVVPASERFRPRAAVDIKTVLHELQLNAWVIAYRRLLGPALLEWRGEPDARIEFSAEARRRLAKDHPPSNPALGRPQPIWPDAALDVALEGGGTRTYLVEFDRTKRPDKNRSKFLRYDALFAWWWRETDLADQPSLPKVVFVCCDEDSVVAFMQAANEAFTLAPDSFTGYPGRRQALFVVERDIHAGDARAWRLPPEPVRAGAEFLPHPTRLVA